MPGRRQPPRSAPEQATDEFDREYETALKSIVAEAGPPPGMKRVSPARELALWGRMDPHVDEATMLPMLMQTGIPGAAEMTVVLEHPDLGAAYSQPQPDPEIAEALVMMAKYPFRYAIWAQSDDPDEWVKKANAMDRAWQRQMSGGAASVEAEAAAPTPDPMRPATLATATEAPMPAPAGGY